MIRIGQGLLLGALVTLVACAKDEARAKDDGPGIAVGDQVFPSVASSTEYTTWSKQRGATAVQRSADFDVALGFGAPRGKRVEIDVGTHGLRERKSLVLADGRPSIRPDLPLGSVDILELLPQAGTRLELRQPYDSPSPDVDYILSEADHNRLVLWQQLAQVPTEMAQVGDKTIVRVEGRGINRLHFVDDDGSLRSSDLGTAYLNVADLVSIPGQGWQVLRFARLSEVQGADKDPGMDLAAARTHDHATFVVCASRMDVAGPELAQLHAALNDDVPEFAACASK